MTYDTLDYPVTAIDCDLDDVFSPDTKDPWMIKLCNTDWLYTEGLLNNDKTSPENKATNIIYYAAKRYSPHYRPLGRVAEQLYALVKANDAYSNFRAKHLERLSEIKTFEDGWDGFDGSPISSEAGKLTELILDSLHPSLVVSLDYEDINPTPDGTVTLQWFNSNNDYFLVEIGKTQVVYFYEVAGEIKGQCLPSLFESQSTMAGIKTCFQEFFIHQSEESPNEQHEYA